MTKWQAVRWRSLLFLFFFYFIFCFIFYFILQKVLPVRPRFQASPSRVAPPERDVSLPQAQTVSILVETRVFFFRSTRRLFFVLHFRACCRLFPISVSRVS